ncbi:MAG TPA: response regulator transcription factor [Saprospiraceae bacterium]|nr:response regulator transcription factor [Saprospiraceae bacterium]
MKIKVIIYEDNQVFRESLVRLLGSSPSYEVVGAFPHCVNIEDEIKNLQPQVALMDIQMPGVNGLKGLEIIRQHSNDIKVIMLTVFEDNKNIFDAIRKGANGYLLKQSSPVQIFSAIDEVLKGGAPLTPSIASSVLTLLSDKKVTPVGNKYQLTPREKEILESLVEGNSYKMIASALFISPETVKTHIKKVYEKLQVNSQTEAVSKAMKEKIV